ncbi:MAG: alkaline phosphatase family protein [Candidatus Helarchaeota archaeon]
MNKPLLSIFADGLRFDSLQYMPFVNSLNAVPLETVLGHSITCHPSMYSGLYPDKHKIAFHWVKSKHNHGPYTPLSYFPDIFPFSHPYVQAIISHFYTKAFLPRRVFMGYGKILNLPMKFWKYLDVNETKYWDEKEYLGKEIKTIFEIVKENKKKYHISGLYKPNLGKLEHLEYINPGLHDWTYYFIGDVDHLSHEYTQHSKETIEYLKKLDKFIEKAFKDFERAFGKNNFTLIFWSDHGHIPIIKKYNLYEEFKKQGYNLKKLFHLIDSTTVRFWIDTDKEKEIICDIMGNVNGVNLLSKEGFKNLHLPNDRNLYGDLFYYLDGGIIFTHTIHGFGLKTKSMHGYHPLEEGNKGVFVTNKEIQKNIATLPDIFVSTIAALNLEYNSRIPLDGKNIISL